MYIYIYICVCMYIYMYTCMYIYICISKFFAHIENHSHAIPSGKLTVCELENGHRNSCFTEL